MAQHEIEDTGRTVVGMFPTRSEAESAIRDLKDAGFSDDRIGVALQDPNEQRELIESAGGSTAEGAATGALSGGLVGGLIGLLGSLLIPGVGPIVVGGVLASTLTGAGVGAATGGIIGALVGMGVPEADAAHFDQGVRSGRTLVTVSAGARTEEALAILERHGIDFGPSGRQRYGLTEPRSWVNDPTDTATVGDPRLAGLDAGALGTIDDGIGGAGGSDAGIGSPSTGTLGGIGAGDVASGSSTGTRGFPSKRDRYTGSERRARMDPAYVGPERRLVGV
jgi:hypothetical protein